MYERCEYAFSIIFKGAANQNDFDLCAPRIRHTRRKSTMLHVNSPAIWLKTVLWLSKSLFSLSYLVEKDISPPVIVGCAVHIPLAIAMTPFVIEPYATDIIDEAHCSSNVDCKGRGLSMTESDCVRESFESFTPQQENKASPRFSLRKRTVPNDQRGDVISSYNSDFLTGLFEDLAKASTSSSSVEEELDPRLDETLSSKKSRLSLTRSMSRCGRSCANLVAVSPMPEQGHHPVINVKALMDATKSQRASQQDLHHCVSSSSSDESNSFFCKLAFPHLPSSVSDSSLSLTRKGQQPPESEKNTYGWFVEIDDDYDHDVDAYSTSTFKNLAFIAPTAPKAHCYDAEVEWAKAADTIDDVLGDFF